MLSRFLTSQDLMSSTSLRIFYLQCMQKFCLNALKILHSEAACSGVQLQKKNNLLMLAFMRSL